MIVTGPINLPLWQRYASQLRFLYTCFGCRWGFSYALKLTPQALSPRRNSAGKQCVSSWSLGGKSLDFWLVDPATNADIRILRKSGGKPFAFLKTEFNEMQPRSDGTAPWLETRTSRSGSCAIYLRQSQFRTRRPEFRAAALS